MMLGAIRQVTVLLALAVAGVAADEPAPDELPRRRAIAGLRGLQVRSTLSFAHVAEKQTFVSTFVFPHRARLSMHKLGGSEAVRRIHYRLGSRAWTLPKESATSRELEAKERLDVLRDLELRRAAFLWPDGFEWKTDEATGETRAALGELGEAYAELGDDGSLKRLWTLDADGNRGATFRIDGWHEAFNRQWPESWSIEADEQVVATESVDRIDVAVHLIDAYFLPPDRRDGGTALPNDVAHANLPRALERRVELTSEQRAWPAALAAWTRELGATEADVASTPIFELDERGLPATIVLRLEERPEEAPEGFAERPERIVLSRIGLSLETVDGSTVRALARLCPSEAQPSRAYLRLAEPKVDAAAQLVLPLE